MYRIDEYHEAESISHALDLLAEDPERLIIAGGTDLLVKLRNKDLEKAKLVGIGRIESLRTIRHSDDGSIIIGPMATFSMLAYSSLIQKHASILEEAALTVGGPQIRNVATLGGNLCNGVPSADSAPALLCLDASLKLLSAGGERTIPLRDFYLGPGRVDLQPGEMLTEIQIKKDNYSGFGGAYTKFSPRKAMDLAIIGVACMCSLNGGCFSSVKIALAVAGPTPLRCPEAEDFAISKPVNDENLAAIGLLAAKAASPRSSVRASKDYRLHLIEELTRRTLKKAAFKDGGDLDA